MSASHVSVRRKPRKHSLSNGSMEFTVTIGIHVHSESRGCWFNRSSERGVSSHQQQEKEPQATCSNLIEDDFLKFFENMN